MATEPTYSIPARWRRMENAHIIFWLLKDLAWCLVWKPLGIAMAVPTLIISIVIAYRTRKLASELAHNLAICFWIAANSYWMASEFFGFDEVVISGSIVGRHIAVIPFGIGLLILAWYYLIQRPKENKAVDVVTM